MASPSGQETKRSITGLIATQAYVHTKDARQWHREREFRLEVQECIMAQLLMGLLVEGVANELGEELCQTWVWERLEQKSDTAFKWWFLSSQDGRTAFNPGAEPLQTIGTLIRIRNPLAHPKTINFGSEDAVQDMAGNVTFPAMGTLNPGDKVITVSYILWQRHGYNYLHSLELLKKTIDAVVKLRDHLGWSGFRWADEVRAFVEAHESAI
jgi:hypothetical protein